MQSSYNSSLFLHFGPGSNCFVERAIYGNTLPIEWWDQPHFRKETLHASSILLNAAREKIMSMQNNSEKKITLIGNSYGAYLATAVAAMIPDIIEKVVILGSQPKLSLPYIHLAEFLIKNDPKNLNLKNSLANFKLNINQDTFWLLIQEISTIPNFMQYYWLNKASNNFHIWSQIANERKLINFDTFTAIINDHLIHNTFTKLATDKVLNIPAQFIYGQSDPFLNETEDIKLWQNIFPNLQTKALLCGHFIHLEENPTNWFELH